TLIRRSTHAYGTFPVVDLPPQSSAVHNDGNPAPAPPRPRPDSGHVRPQHPDPPGERTPSPPSAPPTGHAAPGAGAARRRAARRPVRARVHTMDAPGSPRARGAAPDRPRLVRTAHR